MSFPIAAAVAFNLICSGEAWSVSKLLSVPKDQHAFQIVYRIDLSSERFCVGDCSTTFPLKQVTETKIVFDEEERGPLDDTVAYVNRENGKYFQRQRTYIAGDTVLISVAEGKCERAPFTGFPARKF